ncbi:hypothetical protein Bca4012_093704 [Brassica carinata]
MKHIFRSNPFFRRREHLFDDLSRSNFCYESFGLHILLRRGIPKVQLALAEDSSIVLTRWTASCSAFQGNFLNPLTGFSPEWMAPEVLRNEPSNGNNIEIALARNEPDASSRSSWFPESPVLRSQRNLILWCGGKDHLGMLANVSHEKILKNICKEVTNILLLVFCVWTEIRICGPPLLTDGSPEAFASFTTRVSNCEYMKHG